MPRAPDDPGDQSVEAYLQSLQELHQRLDEGMSWSGNERNCVFLNTGASSRIASTSSSTASSTVHPRFANVSAVSGLDFADDARGLAFFDWDGDGDLDLALSNRTAPRARLMRNSSPASGRSVSFTLRGDGERTNRDAIGARVALATSSGQLLRTLRAGEGFLSQSSKLVHFGLGTSQPLGTVRVRWPGGSDETFNGIQAGSRYRLLQGSGHASRVDTPARAISLAEQDQSPPPPSTGERVVLATRPPAPALSMLRFGEQEEVPAIAVTVRDSENDRSATPATAPPTKVTLVNLWATWCIPCRQELQDFAAQENVIRSAAIDIVALATDGLGESPRSTAVDAQRFMKQIEFPFTNGRATEETLDKVDLINRYLFDRRFPLSLPFSLLIDGDGRIAALYRGGVEPRALLADLALIGSAPADLRAASVPFEGRSYVNPPENASIVAYARWFEERYPDEAVALLERGVERSRERLESTDLSERDLSGRDLSGGDLSELDRAQARGELLEALRRLAVIESKLANHQTAAAHHRSVLELEPNDVVARNGLLDAWFESGALAEARVALEALLAHFPNDVDLRVRLAEVLDGQNDPEGAAGQLSLAIQARPGSAKLHFLLGQMLAKLGRTEDAARQMRRTVELEPERAGAHNYLAFAAANRGQTEAAVGHYLRALESEPQNLEALYGLARTYVGSGRIADAAARYRALIEASPDNPTVHHELGLALLRLGEHTAALENLQRAYSIDPKFLSAANSVAWILATHHDEARRNGRVALSLARDINQRADERGAAFLETLAAALAETGDFGAAVQAVEQAIALTKANGKEREAELLAERLALYRAGKPFRQARPH